MTASRPPRALRAAATAALLALAAGCGESAVGDAAEAASSEDPAAEDPAAEDPAAEDPAAEAGGAEVADGPVGAAIDAPAASTAESEPERAAASDDPAAAADASAAPEAAASGSGDATALYADGAATGSGDARDQLAAQALGSDVLAMREEAKARARELEEAAADGDYRFVDFERLVFEDYSPPEFRGDGAEPLRLEDFPEDVRALDGQKVQLAGFMIAVDFKDQKIEDFMLCRFPPGCCFGGVPLFDEWIDCTPTYAEDRDWSPYEMILVEGTLAVGEVVDEDGFVLSIYRMQVDDVRPFD